MQLDNNHETRAGIYEYFYGRNVVFQAYIVFASIVMFMISLRVQWMNDALGIILKVFAIVGFLAGIAWLIYKKVTYDLSGEQSVDRELAEQTERAKIKGLEKLNLIAEQVEQVEPVCLYGVAPSFFEPQAAVKSLYSRFLRNLGWFLLAILAAVICILITAENVIAGLVIYILAAGGIGILLFMFYEQVKVNPATLTKMRRYDPVLKRRINAEGAVRYSLPEITIYMFGSTQLYLYYQHYDLVTGEVFTEGIKEYFYEDIVAVTSNQKILNFVHKSGFLKPTKYFKRVREEISIYSSGCSHNTSYITDIGESILDTKFVAMRNLIRSKKDDT